MRRIQQWIALDDDAWHNRAQTCFCGVPLESRRVFTGGAAINIGKGTAQGRIGNAITKQRDTEKDSVCFHDCFR